MGFKIGSFNMYKMKDHDVEKKDYQKIAEIIEGFDIVAMQEVFDTSCLDKIMGYLGTQNWEYVHAKPDSRSSQAAEGYAFIWNNKKFRMATSIAEDESDPDLKAIRYRYHPRIYNEYDHDILSNFDSNDESSRGLVRDPLYGRFESVEGNGWFELRLINTHIMFSDHSNEDFVAVSDATKRKAEFTKLLQIYSKISNRVYKNNRPAYTFLLGDYNLSLNRKHTKWPYVSEVIELKDGKVVQEYPTGIDAAIATALDTALSNIDKKYKRIITVQQDLTTLKGRSSSDPNTPAEGFANNYDHFSYDMLRFGGVSVDCQSIDTVAEYCGGENDAHRKNISDHIPIFVDLDLKNGSGN